MKSALPSNSEALFIVREFIELEREFIALDRKRIESNERIKIEKMEAERRRASQEFDAEQRAALEREVAEQRREKRFDAILAAFKALVPAFYAVAQDASDDGASTSDATEH